MAKILVVEDNQNLNSVLRDSLKRENFDVETTLDGADAMHMIALTDYDLIILDWELPGMQGIEVLKKLRQKGKSTPVLMLTGKDTLEDKEAGFRSGTDDYLTKPFEMRELIMRLQALLRRAAGSHDTSLRAGPLELHTLAHNVTVNGQELHLPKKEYSLLEFFLRHPNQIFSNNTLLERVWSMESDITEESVRTTVSRLRRKLKRHNAENLIENIRGSGYRLVKDQNAR